MKTKISSPRTAINWKQHISPGVKRTLLGRRLLALALCVLAVALGWRSALETTPEVVVVTQDIPAGQVLQASHLTQAPMNSFAGDTFRIPSDAIGKTTAYPLRTGDTVSARSVLSTELADALSHNSEGEASYEPFALVPIKLADPTTAALLYPGVTVSVVNASEKETEVLASQARVVLATEKEKDTLAAGSVIVALPQALGEQVAAASLRSPLTVIVTSPSDNSHTQGAKPLI
ncbi:SAF domain-containing protein [Corynebacterium epidermidicanis]|uniref:SAF domain-containing protein n=1 Tax=Corynebacterium epidermidicanis TaxID=1050174 RepID=A0A0G3GQ51_9CORY|nr:SAF domain-containing protein [Corynebacterium epidermidicanis]AKK02680.1 SAF domain-containing protein [Corynebacterium epidermidicanis]